MQVLSVAVGGALGAVSRYFLGNFISRIIGSALPYGTFVINIVGCFFMGLIMTMIIERGMLSVAWRLFLCVGFLGGFTTFSSFGYETLVLLQEERFASAMLYVGGSVFCGLAAATVGVTLARLL